MSSTDNRSARSLLYTVYFIYFFCGMALCFEGAFNPEFKDYFHLSYQQQQYTTFAKNIPFVLAVLIGFYMPRVGYKNCLSVAMVLFAAGTLLLVPALQNGNYKLVLTAFFIIGMGFNFELVAGNPLLSSLGPPEGSSSRLNLGNALGAIAQIIAPFILSLLIPASSLGVTAKMPYMKGLFTTIGVFLIGIFFLTLMAKNFNASSAVSSADDKSGRMGSSKIWTRPRVILGFVTIFLVLGAEASLFSLFRNYLEDPAVAGASSHASQALFTVFFAVFALGRLAGSWVQKRVNPAYSLACNAVAALLFVSLMVITNGSFAIIAIIFLGFSVSIFFPTIYSLAIEGLGDQTAEASGLLTMGFLGCAVLPVLQGRLADSIGLRHSFAICVVPYLFALFYALKICRPTSSVNMAFCPEDPPGVPVQTGPPTDSAK